MPPKRKSESQEVDTSNQQQQPTYGDEVLGRQCLVLFDVESEERVPYRGTITALDADLKLEYIVQNGDKETKPRAKKKAKTSAGGPRRKKYTADHGENWKPVVTRLHLVVFDDGDEMWLDLGELQADGRLWWQENEDDKAAVPTAVTNTPTTPAVTETTPNPAAAWQQQQQQQQQLAAWQQQQIVMGSMMMNRAVAAMNNNTNPAQTQAAVNAALESYRAQTAGTTTAGATTTPGTDEPKKKRGGRKKGSKNKPKNPPPTPAAEGDNSQGETPATGTTTAVTTETDKPTDASMETSETDKQTSVETPTVPETPEKKKTPRKKTPEKPFQPTGIGWIDEMAIFLQTVPHGSLGKPASIHNTKKVLGTITKLAKGEGVGTKAWPVVFYEGQQVDLQTDLALLQQHVNEFHEQYGDPSGGWLLRQPIQKLLFFKEYKKDPEAFVKSAQEATAKRPSPKKSPAKKKQNTTAPASPSAGPTVSDPVIEGILAQAAAEVGMSYHHPPVANGMSSGTNTNARLVASTQYPQPRLTHTHAPIRYVPQMQTVNPSPYQPPLSPMQMQQQQQQPPTFHLTASPQGSDWSNQFFSSPPRGESQA